MKEIIKVSENSFANVFSLGDHVARDGKYYVSTILEDDTQRLVYFLRPIPALKAALLLLRMALCGLLFKV